MALLGWASTSICLPFGVGFGGFRPLCWPFLHMDSEPKFYLIFGVFIPDCKNGFNFVEFWSFLTLPQFAYHSSFLGISWH